MKRKQSAALPVWYDPLSPLGSFVRGIAGLSGHIRWVGVFRHSGNREAVLAQLGERSSGPEVKLDLMNSEEKKFGSVRIQILPPGSMGPPVEEKIQLMTKELAQRWDELEK